MQAPLILASGSPRRKALLESLGLAPKVVVSQVIEQEDSNFPPLDMVLYNARIKAEWAAERYPNSWIIAADTTVSLGNKVYNKPIDRAQAAEMLMELSGKTHTVYTGVYIINLAKKISTFHCETSMVTFKKLTPDIIHHYHSLLNPLDRAGAYSIEDHADLIIENYQGSLSNIRGLPIEYVQSTLLKLITP